jgi:hypothetical protein
VQFLLTDPQQIESTLRWLAHSQADQQEKTMIVRLSLALMTAAALAGCASNHYLVDESSSPSVSQADVQAQINAPDPGARAIPPSQMGSSASSTYNSDNRGTITRSGLNSDPDNPSGAPGSPRGWDSI